MILCFDIGGTSIKYGVADEKDGGIVFHAREETPTNAKTLQGPGIERRLLELVDALRGTYKPAGVAISTAGMVDFRTGKILYANENIPNYTGINLKTTIEKTFGLPCAVENDVNAAALGEAAYGAARGTDSALCLTVGTGIGGAIVLEGKVWHGHAGSAGEVGYLPLDGQTLEDRASVTALVRRVAEQTGEIQDGKQIFSRAQAGDSICTAAIESLCAALAQGISGCLCVFNPEVVVLGGGIMAQQAYLRPRLEYQLKQCCNPFVLAHTTLAFAQLGNSAGMAGACRWLQQSAPYTVR